MQKEHIPKLQRADLTGVKKGAFAATLDLMVSAKCCGAVAVDSAGAYMLWPAAGRALCLSLCLPPYACNAQPPMHLCHAPGAPCMHTNLETVKRHAVEYISLDYDMDGMLKGDSTVVKAFCKYLENHTDTEQEVRSQMHAADFLLPACFGEWMPHVGGGSFRNEVPLPTAV